MSKKRVRYHKGSWGDAIRAAKALDADHDIYLFPTALGIAMGEEPPPFGLQHIIVKTDGSHKVVSAASSFNEGRMVEAAKKLQTTPRAGTVRKG